MNIFWFWGGNIGTQNHQSKIGATARECFLLLFHTLAVWFMPIWVYSASRPPHFVCFSIEKQQTLIPTSSSTQEESPKSRQSRDRREFSGVIFRYCAFAISISFVDSKTCPYVVSVKEKKILSVWAKNEVMPSFNGWLSDHVSIFRNGTCLPSYLARFPYSRLAVCCLESSLTLVPD